MKPRSEYQLTSYFELPLKFSHFGHAESMVDEDGEKKHLKQ